MKKSVTLLLLSALIMIPELFAQAEFSTGAITANVSNYARLRIAAPDATIRQIDRSSILVGVGQNTVYDYWMDSDTLVLPVLVTNPTMSDFEIDVTNMTLAGNSPQINHRMNVYGWNTLGYVLVKHTITNKEANAMNAYIGMEVIPQVEGTYGNEWVSCDSANALLKTYKTFQVGYKLLNKPLASFTAFEWYDGYNNDADTMFFRYMSMNKVEPVSYLAGGDGAVSIFNAPAVNINPNESAELWIAVAVGADENTFNTNLAAAVAKYNQLTSVDDENGTPQRFRLSQNYPNPFNPSTSISYTIDSRSNVKLQIFDVLGNMVAEPVNEEKEAGSYNVNFNASGLTSGTYFYRLSAGNSSLVKKMTLIK